MAYSIAVGSPLSLDQAKAASLIDILQIGHGRSHLVPERQHRDAGLQAAGPAQQVAGHRLGRADQQRLRRFAEGLADRPGFGSIAERGGSGVRVQIPDVSRVQLQRPAEPTASPGARPGHLPEERWCGRHRYWRRSRPARRGSSLRVLPRARILPESARRRLPPPRTHRGRDPRAARRLPGRHCGWRERAWRRSQRPRAGSPQLRFPRRSLHLHRRVESRGRTHPPHARPWCRRWRRSDWVRSRHSESRSGRRPDWRWWR